MIEVSLVEESNHILKNIEGVKLADIVKDAINTDRLSYNQYDFDTNSFLDLIEYTDFQDLSDYIFVSFSKNKRLDKIVNLLNEYSEITKFRYITIDKCSDSNIEDYIDKSKMKLFEKEVDSSEVVLKNGLLALFTGVYPNVFRKNLIKHIYLENMNLANKLDMSVYLNSAINHGVYIDEKKSSEVSLPGVVVYQDTLESFNKTRDLQLLEPNELEERMSNFIDNGEIIGRDYKLGIIDYDTILSAGLGRRLLIFNSGIYLDYRSTQKVTSKVGSSFLEIELGKSELLVSNSISGFIQLFPMLINVSLELNAKKIRFITPFNKNKFKACVLDNYKNEWLVFSEEDDFYAYHFMSSRMFQVNELFAEIFEADIKGCLEEAKHINLNITNEIVSEQKELMLNV